VDARIGRTRIFQRAGRQGEDERVPEAVHGEGSRRACSAVVAALARCERGRTLALPVEVSTDMSPSSEAQVLLAQARAEHPGIAVSDDRFLAHLARHARTDLKVAAGDLLIAVGCLEGDRTALARFDELLSSIVGPAVRHLGSASFADDLRQLLRVRLLVAEDRDEPRIAEYAGSGPLGGFVRVAAVRLALNVKAAERRTPEDLGRVVESAGADPELEYLRARYGGHLATALAKAVDALSDRDRALLRMHHARAMTVDELGRLFGVHRATAARWVARARQDLLAAVAKELSAILGIDGAEAASLIRLVDSRLDLSLRGLLAEDADV
jgi:RNA polymerase sigma-70 factor (ECF subfamily)